MANGAFMPYKRYASVDLPENEYLKSQKKYNDELAKMFEDQMSDRVDQAKKDQEKKDKFASEAAAKVVQPSTSGMFDSDFSIAEAWANHLMDEATINQYAESDQGMAEYNKAIQELNAFIAEAQSYYTTNYGTADDAADASTWGGAAKRFNSKDNPWSDQFLKDEYDEAYYSSVLQELDNPSAHTFSVDENGQILIDGKSHREFVRRENPFRASLVESGYETGYTYYLKRQGKGRLHDTEKQVREFMEDRFKNDDALERNAVRQYIDETGLELTVDEVLDIPDHREKAINNFIDDALRAWTKPKGPEPTAQERMLGKAERERQRQIEAALQSVTLEGYDPESDDPLKQGANPGQLWYAITQQTPGSVDLVPMTMNFPLPVSDSIEVLDDEGNLVSLKVNGFTFNNLSDTIVLKGTTSKGSTLGVTDAIEVTLDLSDVDAISSLNRQLMQQYGLSLKDLIIDKTGAAGVSYEGRGQGIVVGEQVSTQAPQGETRSTGAADNL